MYKSFKKALSGLYGEKPNPRTEGAVVTDPSVAASFGVPVPGIAILRGGTIDEIWEGTAHMLPLKDGEDDKELLDWFWMAEM
mmetsp:Transcript_3618/g.9878  ORF Transcript_3618/g.9878 Transcript_3618/m.9878 type:complete len:82 (+) Transcript_3618:209-454(+)